MSEVIEQEAKSAASHAQKYTRNNPFQSYVRVNYLLTGEGSEKETRHVELTLDEGMTYTPGDAVGIIPENRREAVDDVLKALGYTGDERVLDHYKVEISLEEALRTRLGIGKLARGSVGQYAKLAPDVEGLKVMVGPDNKARAEEYCWGREFVDLAADFPGVGDGAAAVVQRAAAVDTADVLDCFESGAASGQRTDNGARDSV